MRSVAEPPASAAITANSSQSGRSVVVFNIKGNDFRLVTAIHYNRGKVFVLRFLTPAEYTRDVWKDEL